MKAVEKRTGFDDFQVTDWIEEGVAGEAKIDVRTVGGISAMRASFNGERLHKGDRVTSLYVRNYLVMSDTRDEYRDHWEAIHKATGRVLIHGLGLGCYLKAILAKDDVTHVDVVELSTDVIALVGPYFTDDPRVHIHQGDALTFKFPKDTKWDVAWHDIWANKDTDDLKEHATMNRRYGRAVGWQGCWAHETLLSYRRRGGWWG